MALLLTRWPAHRMMIKEGEVTFNGSKLNKRLKRQMGYVLQVRSTSWFVLGHLCLR